MLRIENYYMLIKLHPSGEEEVLYSSTNLERVQRERDEKQWSSICNTGHNRTDLHIATFTRGRKDD